MKKLLVLLVLLQGCRISENSNANPNAQKTFPGLQSMETRNLSDAEIAIGKRICNAIKTKRLHFETLPNLTHKISMLAELKSCNTSSFKNEGEFQVILENSNSTDLEYRTTARLDNFQNVVTDLTSPISAYCKSFSDNLKNISNSVFEGNYKYVFFFKTLNSAGSVIDAYEMTRHTRNGAGEYALTYAENNSFFTNATQTANSNLVGLERTRERYNACKTADQYTIYRETFKRALTSF